MDSTKILIIGANGQLGRALTKKYPNANSVDLSTLDITDKNAVDSFDWSNVQVILNVAAYTNVDNAEKADGRAAAWKVNAVAVSYLADISLLNNITLIHISTDYVFDGTKTPHLEDESLSPLNVYGSSKAAGDITLSNLPKHYIFRTSWVIGDGNNFVRTMLELGKKGVNPKVVGDQIGRLTFTDELVRVIDYVLENNAPYGTYNVTNSGEPSSWADITRTTYKLAGINNKVESISTSTFYADKPESAPRPLNSILALEKLHQIGFESRDWKENLYNYINRENQ
jgi:dTDP-4-dehydrorhamnose 3,5-epimerase